MTGYLTYAATLEHNTDLRLGADNSRRNSRRERRRALRSAGRGFLRPRRAFA